jgi:hypothetical protein
MDFLILWSVARFGRFRTNWLRLLVAALLGSFYLLIILLFPKPGFLGTIGVKLLVSLIMILLAFPWHSLKLFFQALACFYFISFMVGGAMLGGICFLQGSIWPGEFLQGVFFLYEHTFRLVVGRSGLLVFVRLFGFQFDQKRIVPQTLSGFHGGLFWGEKNCGPVPGGYGKPVT